jgi:hypothetical protein
VVSIYLDSIYIVYVARALNQALKTYASKSITAPISLTTLAIAMLFNVGEAE